MGLGLGLGISKIVCKFLIRLFKIPEKFAKDLQITQTQKLNTQKIEDPNPDLNLWVLLGAYVC